jgi:hypothetical protein
MSRKIAVGIVVFKASQPVLDRISMMVLAGFNVYIFDNSPELENVKGMSKNIPCVRYFTCGKNVGLGYGISTVCAQAYADDMEALVFFDQDTGFSIETLEFIENYYVSHLDIVDSYSSFWFNAKAINCENAMRDQLKDVDLSINSGSLYFLDKLKILNWHDCGYFVDGVDYKYCLDTKNAGLKIGECSYTPGFDHVSEQDDRAYRFFSKEYYLRPYPLFRIVDTSKASLKLVISSLVTRRVKFAAKFVKLYCIYLATQLLVRIAPSEVK